MKMIIAAKITKLWKHIDKWPRYLTQIVVAVSPAWHLLLLSNQ